MSQATKPADRAGSGSTCPDCDEPLVFTFFTNLASSLGPGSVSSFNFASDYQVVPVSLILKVSFGSSRLSAVIGTEIVGFSDTPGAQLTSPVVFV